PKSGECRAFAERTIRYPTAYPGRMGRGGPSRMNENAKSVDTEVCSEFLNRPVNVVPWRIEHYATSPHIPVGRVAVRPSCIRQNVKSVDTEFCSEFFHWPVNVVTWRNEQYATPPQKQGGRVVARPTPIA
ncbi:hypothetical protein TNCT_527761, partial [Trichonephila clavata]